MSPLLEREIPAPLATGGSASGTLPSFASAGMTAFIKILTFNEYKKIQFQKRVFRKCDF